MSLRGIAVRTVALVAALGCAVLFGQTKPTVPGASAMLEFPVTMQQKVVAGTTPVGTKVEAKLQVATLVNGTVIPVGAIFSGQVIESAAKSASEPSRLAIRMDSMRWKKGSAPLEVYLTAWYYPVRMAMNDGSLDEPAASPITRTRRGSGIDHPDSPFPGSPAPDGLNLPPPPTSPISDKRVMMKDVESTRRSDGTVALSSKRMNIKLDKSTTYVLATGELPSAK